MPLAIDDFYEARVLEKLGWRRLPAMIHTK
jgi:hypothetical protein